MSKILLIALLSFSLLQASPPKDTQCTVDMKQMFKSFYIAERNSSLINYQKSIRAAYGAIENCTGNDDYDFDIMYNFIQVSQKRIELLTF